MSSDRAADGTGVLARAATWADAEALAATLSRAFFDDPFMCFILKNETTRPALMPHVFELLFRLGLPHGACVVTPGYEAAALWRPPGAWRTPWWDYLANGSEVLGILGFGGARHVVRVMDLVEKHHPQEPHWYLQSVGTDPAKQGKGFGGAVIRSQLANADASGLPAYLETSKETNIPIYRSFGFEVSGEIKLPDGPAVWLMWRKARTLHP
jgi:ribosomal protein S18 acetylase RimI-like enzyme